jgi:hypothetical protein
MSLEQERVTGIFMALPARKADNLSSIFHPIDLHGLLLFKIYY